MLTADDWIAIGTGALAVGTFVLAWVTVRTGTKDRRHDDEKRAEDGAVTVTADKLHPDQSRFTVREPAFFGSSGQEQTAATSRRVSRYSGAPRRSLSGQQVLAAAFNFIA